MIINNVFEEEFDVGFNAEDELIFKRLQDNDALQKNSQVKRVQFQMILEYISANMRLTLK